MANDAARTDDELVREAFTTGRPLAPGIYRITEALNPPAGGFLVA